VHASPNVRVIKSRDIRQAGHVARRGHKKYIQSENQKGRDHSDDLGLDRMIILEWILNIGRVWTEFIWLRKGTSGGPL